MHVDNDLFTTNENKTAILSKDKTKLICMIQTIENFEIPEGIRVIGRKAFYFSAISGKLIIPASVEVIEDEAFKYCEKLEVIEFSSGSNLKSIGFSAFYHLTDLIITNKNFVKDVNGVVMSLNPRGIVFVPQSLTELQINSDIEIIYSYAFNESQIKSLSFPMSLKKIC